MDWLREMVKEQLEDHRPDRVGDIKAIGGKNWLRLAQNRDEWQKGKEAYMTQLDGYRLG